MDLHSSNEHALINLLPYDGVVNYYGKLMDEQTANSYFSKIFSEVPWERDRFIFYGKEIITNRKLAWFGDQPFAYAYSHIVRKALIWSPILLKLKSQVEEISGETYNSCLLNLYHSGDEGMGWHADDEKELKPNGAIASISFGAERKFAFKHKKTGEVVTTWLEQGSLLVMKGVTQTHWLHRLPVTKKVKTARINLTFRTISVGAQS